MAGGKLINRLAFYCVYGFLYLWYNNCIMGAVSSAYVLRRSEPDLKSMDWKTRGLYNESGS